MKKEDLINKIKMVFSDVTLRDGIGLWEAQAIDDYEPESVQRKNRQKDEKTDWSSFNYTELQRCHSSLSFFDASGMRFHLPAFLIGSIKGELDDPVFHLTQLDDYAKSKLTTLNAEQREAVVAYLNWCLQSIEYQFEHVTIKRALDKYWI